MYTAFYGLREKPFQLSPDPRFLFLAESHREALAHLLFGIEQGQGFIAVTGEVGTGKTTLCRTLLQRLDPGAEVAILFNPQLSAQELLEAIHVELGIEMGSGSRRELMERLNRFLLEKSEHGRRVLLIVDEAQSLGADALEQIRMLSNLETETQKLIQIILLGQPEFDAMLESPSLRQLRQRISVRWRLEALTAAETAEYVRHRLRIAAGARRDLFSEAALREIHRRSGGIPRVINLLSDRALLSGYAAGAGTVSLPIVVQADRELRGGAEAPPLAPAAPGVRARLRRHAPVAALLGLGVAMGLFAQRLVGPEPLAPAPVAPEPPETTAASAPLDTAPARPPELGTTSPRPDAAPEAVAEPPPAPAGPARLAGGELEALLASSEPAVGIAAALDASLDAWGLAPAGARALTLEAALAELRARGLSVLPVNEVDAGSLAILGHQAVVSLRAPGGGERHALLDAVGAESVRLVGLRGDREPIRLAREDFDARVVGEAQIVWRDFEGLPGVLAWGQAGPAVEWLQRALQELGHLADPPSAEFDGPTLAALRAFQTAHGLRPDGAAGPRTQMALYAALARYDLPRLGGDEGGERP
jgi:general secretion pathway protein A